MDKPNKKLWFKRKAYGLGWVPCSWEGWVTLLVHVSILVYFFRKTDLSSHSGSDTLIGFALPFIFFTSLLIAICYIKGESPKWQWGKDKK